MKWINKTTLEKIEKIAITDSNFINEAFEYSYGLGEAILLDCFDTFESLTSKPVFIETYVICLLDKISTEYREIAINSYTIRLLNNEYKNINKKSENISEKIRSHKR